MKKILMRGLGVAALTMAFAAGCTDGVTPDQSSHPMAPSSPSFDHGVVKDTVVTILRTTPLPNDLWAFRIITKEGGELDLPEAGLKVVFGPNAVKKPTKIVVKAHAGSSVVYTFHPHGLVFGGNVRIEQALQNTDAFQKNVNLIGGYFESDSSLRPDGTAEISEILPTEWVQTGNKIKFFIHHFSGYLLGVS